MSSDGGGGSGIGTDFIFFLGILILFFAFWLTSGGPNSPLSFSGPFLRPITQTATTAQPYGDNNQFQSIQGTSWLPTFLGGSGSEAGDASSNRGSVTLGRDASGAKATNESREYVTISVSYGASAVSTAGWKLSSKESGVSVPFPGGTEVARAGRVNALSTIELRPGDQVIVVSGRSPVGASFRENACTGYLEEHQNFTPALTLQCPSAYQEYREIENDDECSSYFTGFPLCASESTYQSDPPTSCEEFAEEHLNYNACVAAHEDEQSFRSGTWRVYLGASDELWGNDHDTILLLDAEGKTIDTLAY
jgi:hypothetical protein